MSILVKGNGMAGGFTPTYHARHQDSFSSLWMNPGAFHSNGKFAGEQALRQRQPELIEMGIRLIVVTGDLVDGTITPKLLERSAPTVIDQRRQAISATFGQLPTATEMGEAIAVAATDATLPGGHTVVVGGSLESLLSL